MSRLNDSLKKLAVAMNCAESVENVQGDKVDEILDFMADALTPPPYTQVGKKYKFKDTFSPAHTEEQSILKAAITFKSKNNQYTNITYGGGFNTMKYGDTTVYAGSSEWSSDDYKTIEIVQISDEFTDEMDAWLEASTTIIE